MNLRAYLTGMLLLILALPAGAVNLSLLEGKVTEKGNLGERMIYPGDTLRIYCNAFEEPLEAVVGSQGLITVPLLDEINVSGLRIGRVEKIIETGLKKYIKEPNVRVLFSQPMLAKIYVIGEVNVPGVYDYKPGMDVLDCVVLSGCFVSKAALNKVRIIRKNEDLAPEVVNVNVDKFLKTGNYQLIPGLKPDDTVYIPSKPKDFWRTGLEVIINIGLVIGVLEILGVDVNIRSLWE